MPDPSVSARFRCLSIASIALTWLAVTVLFWTGYVGSDDFYYSRYGFLLHRPPINWWEFRSPLILALHASYRLLGASEFAAALPVLLASIAILASVAWFVEWPRKITWQNQFSMMVAATLPVDVGFRSTPYACYFAAGFLTLGSVCLLREDRKWYWAAAPLFAIGFLAHESMAYYLALFCLTLLVFDWQRYFRPVLVCAIVTALAFGVECAVYWALLGDPLARLKVASSNTSLQSAGYDASLGLGGIRFFTWPLEFLVYGKGFAFDLLLLLVTGLATWRKLLKPQRILFVSVFAFWLWFGYGTQVPWAYRPIGRMVYFYAVLTLGVAALLPATLSALFSARPRIWQGILVLALCAHLLNLAAGGRWGQDVKVSRELLAYAGEHPSQHFVTDVTTMNQLYVLNGFRLPANVVCINGPAVRNKLLMNEEPPAQPRFRFPETSIDAALINSEGLDVDRPDPDFQQFLRDQPLNRVRLFPVKYKFAFSPFVSVMRPRSFMILNLGAELASVEHGTAVVNRTTDGSGGQ
jgi:hypothetical protein